MYTYLEMGSTSMAVQARQMLRAVKPSHIYVIVAREFLDKLVFVV